MICKFIILYMSVF